MYKLKCWNTKIWKSKELWLFQKIITPQDPNPKKLKWLKCQGIKKSSYKNDQLPQRGFKQTSEWVR